MPSSPNYEQYIEQNLGVTHTLVFVQEEIQQFGTALCFLSAGKLLKKVAKKPHCFSLHIASTRQIWSKVLISEERIYFLLEQK